MPRLCSIESSKIIQGQPYPHWSDMVTVLSTNVIPGVWFSTIWNLCIHLTQPPKRPHSLDHRWVKTSVISGQMLLSITKLSIWKDSDSVMSHALPPSEKSMKGKGQWHHGGNFFPVRYKPNSMCPDTICFLPFIPLAYYSTTGWDRWEALQYKFIATSNLNHTQRLLCLSNKFLKFSVECPEKL